jgi:hypothetical protein
MTTERELDEILAEVGREHRAIGAPDKLEILVRTAAESMRDAIDTPALRVTWAWAAAMILLAAVVTAGVMWQTRRSHQPQSQQVRSVPVPQISPEPTFPLEPGTGGPSRKSKSAPVRRVATDRTGFREFSSQQATWNSLEEFVPLPVSEGLPLAAELSVVRVKLKGSDLQQYGLEAPADAVTQAMLAEFVVGEDGLPRAIRIVR